MSSILGVSGRVLLLVVVAAVLCAAWCAGALPGDNAPAAAALFTSADSSSGDGSCATASDCYTGAQIVYIQNVLSALRSSLQNTGWPALLKFCVYQHVTCWPSGVVVNFTGVGLTGSLPHNIALNSNPIELAETPITAMIFDNNRGITGTLTERLGYMTQMKTFSATETGLDGTLPETWSAMAALQVLRLTGAPVNGTIPESWSAMRSLKTVSLAGTNITGCLPASWTDKLGLTMTGVGLPEMTACNKASKHKSKMPWWAILILALGIVFVAAAITLAILWWKSKLPCKLLNRKKYCHTGYRLIPMRRNNNRRPIFFGAAEFSAAELAEGRITRDIRRKFRRLREWQERRGIAPPGASAVPGAAPLPASARAPTSATSAPALTDEAVNTQAAPSLPQGGFRRGLIANDDETEDPPAFYVQDERDQQSESGSVQVNTRDAEGGPPQSTLRVHSPYLVRDYTNSRREQDTLDTLSLSNETAFRNPLQPMSELSRERDAASDYDSRTRVQRGCFKRTANEQQRLARRQPLDAASQHEYSLLQDPHTAPQIYGPFLDVDSTDLSV